MKVTGPHRLLLFDNGNQSALGSLAVEYELNEDRMEARLVWQFQAPFSASYRFIGGSVDRLPNGNTVIGWGGVDDEAGSAKPFEHVLFTEVDALGGKVRELIAKENLVSYRVYFKPAP